MKPRMARGSALLGWSLGLAGLLLGAGCARDRYVTREELGRMIGPVIVEAGGDDSAEAAEREAAQHGVVERLVAEAMAAPTVEARTNAALAASDQATARLAQTLAAIDRSQEIILDNLRNADVTAFKATRAVRAEGGEVVSEPDFSQGRLATTANPLDVAICGEGFFRVRMGGGQGLAVAYTRKGNLFVNPVGELLVAIGDGQALWPPISLPKKAGNISISQYGIVECTLEGGSKIVAGRIVLVRFPNPKGLRRVGGGLYLPDGPAGDPIECKPGEDGAGGLLQGYLEESNVDPIHELLRLRFLRNWREAIMQAVDDAPKHGRP